MYPTTTATGYHTHITVLDVRVLEDTKFGVMFVGNDIPDVVGSWGGPGC